MDIHEWLCYKKSVRRKRRLVKNDRDKQLIQLDKKCEKELSYIRNHINNNHLLLRIYRLICGRSYRRKDEYTEHFKYINNIKNIPRNSSKEVCLDLET